MNSYGRHSTNWRDAFAVAWQVKKKSLTQGPKIKEFEDGLVKEFDSGTRTATEYARDFLRQVLNECSQATAEKICEKNCADFAGIEILHLEQCECSCHK